MMHHNKKDKIINVTKGQQLMYVIKEVKKIQDDPNFNTYIEFIIDEADMSKFIMIIRPTDGLYKDLTMHFELTVPEGYPAPGHPIKAICSDNIYHPNIFEGGYLCLTYDGVGNLDTGFKETLENLVIAIKYLFEHPGNYGYGKKMPEHMHDTIKKNVDQYRMRIKVDKIPKNSSDKLYKAKEIYGDTINESLLQIKNWESYLPTSCLTDIKKHRYYMFTLGGRKIMNLEKLENVISQVIRDPRFRFDTAPNIAFLDDEKHLQQIITPSTPFSIVLTKFKRILYPNDIIWDPINECFNSNISFDKFFLNCIRGMYRENNDMIIMCNISIRSNYKFAFTCQKKTNDNYSVLQSQEKLINNRKEYIMTIDQYICNLMAANNSLIVDFNNGSNNDSNNDCSDQYINPSNPLWFYISFSCMIVGKDLAKMFTNIAYRLNPIDKSSPYVTLNHVPPFIRDVTETSIRLLTDDELKLISTDTDDSDSSKLNNDDYYDIELASKYLASTAEQTGLDLSNVRFLS